MIAYVSYIKGSDLAPLGDRRGGPSCGQSKCSLTSPLFYSLWLVAVGVCQLKFEW